MEDEIAGLLGGRAVEELPCGSVATGAANDLERATALAQAMVTSGSTPRSTASWTAPRKERRRC